jgi:hypothetical protein
MNPDELLYCEWPDGKSGPIFHNCPDEENARMRVAERRIEQITKQLDCPHGLTNNERSALAKERERWRKLINQRRPAAVVTDEARQARKRKRDKATEKKLEWLARKVARAQTTA